MRSQLSGWNCFLILFSSLFLTWPIWLLPQKRPNPLALIPPRRLMQCLHCWVLTRNQYFQLDCISLHCWQSYNCLCGGELTGTGLQAMLGAKVGVDAKSGLKLDLLPASSAYSTQFPMWRFDPASDVEARILAPWSHWKLCYWITSYGSSNCDNALVASISIQFLSMMLLGSFGQRKVALRHMCLTQDSVTGIVEQVQIWLASHESTRCSWLNSRSNRPQDSLILIQKILAIDAPRQIGHHAVNCMVIRFLWRKRICAVVNAYAGVLQRGYSLIFLKKKLEISLGPMDTLGVAVVGFHLHASIYG